MTQFILQSHIYPKTGFKINKSYFLHRLPEPYLSLKLLYFCICYNTTNLYYQSDNYSKVQKSPKHAFLHFSFFLDSFSYQSNNGNKKGRNGRSIRRKLRHLIKEISVIHSLNISKINQVRIVVYLWLLFYFFLNILYTDHRPPHYLCLLRLTHRSKHKYSYISWKFTAPLSW